MVRTRRGTRSRALRAQPACRGTTRSPGHRRPHARDHRPRQTIPEELTAGCFRKVSSRLEEGVPLFLGVVGRRAASFHQRNVHRGLEIIAIVAPVLDGHPLGLRLAALVVDRGIKEAAVLTAVQIGVALRAGGVLEDLGVVEHLDGLPAVEAGKTDVAHGRILPPLFLSHYVVIPSESRRAGTTRDLLFASRVLSERTSKSRSLAALGMTVSEQPRRAAKRGAQRLDAVPVLSS